VNLQVESVSFLFNYGSGRQVVRGDRRQGFRRSAFGGNANPAQRVLRSHRRFGRQHCSRLRRTVGASRPGLGLWPGPICFRRSSQQGSSPKR